LGTSTSATQGDEDDHNQLERPEVAYAMFLAHGWILGTAPAQLAAWLDYPRLEVADWFYMRKLAETIKLYRGTTWTKGLVTSEGVENQR